MKRKMGWKRNGIHGRKRRVRVALALGLIYFIWGSTYLAIRIAIDTLPPFLMAGTRFLIAGGFLYAWARARGAERPTPLFWRTAAISGTLLFLGGNGAVVWAEQFVPSGIVSLLAATVPLWIVFQDWGWGRGRAPGAGIVFGIFWGLVGVYILVTGTEIGRASPQDLIGGILVLCGACAWAAGSLVARDGIRPRSASLGNGMQMLAGGSTLVVAGLLRGEVGSFDPGAMSEASLLALAYLIMVGSVVAFSAYVWLLQNTTPAVAATYAYVNPVVALLLGWAFAGEPLSPRTIVAAFVILSSILIITTQRSREGGSPTMEVG